MQEHDLWNHNNYAVSPENFPLVKSCFAAIMPWELWVDKPNLLGFKFSADHYKGMVFFQPEKAAGQFAAAIERLRKQVPDLDNAIKGLEKIPADHNDHNGFMVKDFEEWQRRLALFRKAEKEHPEWKLQVVTVSRPHEPDAISKTIYQVWLRIGLLGPLRNTFEMQCKNPEAVA